MDLELSLKDFKLEYQFRIKSDTINNYHAAIKEFFNQAEKTIEAITKQDIRTWLAYLSSEKGNQPSTINNKLSALKNFFIYCKEEGLIQQNPAKDIKYAYIEKKVPRYLSKEQIITLRKFLEGRIQERAIIEVLYTTGVRISELLAMKKTDINWTERTITIPEGKGDKARIVIFTAECAEHLKVYLDSRADQLPFVFVVLNSIGTSSNSENLVEEWFRYYSKQLGFKVTPHTLRHTFAAHLAQKGMKIEYIQALLGHDRLQTTRIYAQLYDHVRKEKYDDWM